MTELPEIPKTWLIVFLAIILITIEIICISSSCPTNLQVGVTAALMAIIGYLTGQHVESTAWTQQ